MPLSDLFATSAARWPDAIAVDVPPGDARPQRLRRTYTELASDAARIAAALRPHVAGECVVAVLLPRTGASLYAAQLAVLQIGAAHACFDPGFPDDYLAYVLRDSGAVAILTDADGAARVAAAAATCAVLDVAALLAAPAAATPPAAPPAWLAPHTLAYAIYTSGTTGRPKGVLLEHRGIEHLVRAGVERFGIVPGDRIAQGSSPAYDSSLEETWLALAAGATVVVLDDATVRLGPDLVPWLRRERITVLCPPPTLLRAMDCSAPARELPQLRLCYAGGEAMPQDLCDVWARDLWLENGYGPTECTVTVVRGRLQPGAAVTIGKPVPGHDALLLDERLEPVAASTAGELCLRGVGLARGYLGDSQRTAERFPEHPRFGRLYRTGDLAEWDADGNLRYLGRIDAQVKLRGYRIELEAIEAELCRAEGVREAACRVQGDAAAQLLVAWIVPDDPAKVPDAAALLAILRQRLPSYMVPASLGVAASLPRTVGGKLDRKALPEVAVAIAAPMADAHAVAPRDDLEQRIADAFVGRLPSGTAASIDGDFFALGGDSLRAAQVVSRLRERPDTAVLTVRDVYEARTVRALAERVRARPLDTSPSPAAALPTPRGRSVAWVTVAQCLWLAAGIVGASAVVYGIAFGAVPWLFAELGAVRFCLLGPLLAVAALLAHTAVTLALAVLTKRVLVGRYTPGRHPVWSGFYLRHWIVQRTVSLVPWGLLAGTEFQAMALRALGARIGKRVHLHRGVDLLRGGWDLLELGDDVTLGQEANLGLVELDAGMLAIGPVRIAAGATVEVRAGLGPDTELGEGAVLAALSSLPPGSRVPARQRWDGVPARAAGSVPPLPAVTVPSRALSPLAYAGLLTALRALTLPLLAWAGTAAALGVAALRGSSLERALEWLLDPFADLRGVLATLLFVSALVPIALLVQALLLRWTAPTPVGTCCRWSLAYLRLWIRGGMLESAGVWLSGSVLWPWWLRLAGMRVGAGCEISTILDVVPEHVAIGAGSFLADGIYLGVPDVRGGTVTVRATALGERTFLGNHVVVHAGEQLPSDLLLGVCTVADERMTAGSSWFGHPPFLLPRREVVVTDRRLTHEPGLVRYANRAMWELLRFALPIAPLTVALAWLDAVTAAANALGPATFWLLALPAWTLGAAASLCAFVVALKWLLLGRVRPGQHGLWSCWASRWDFLYVAWGFLARRLLGNLEGTLLLGWYARAMGVHVGRRVVLGPGFAQIVDPDMLHLDDDSTVEAMFQAHSFEDRVLKIDRVRIGARATVARGTVLLYGADIGEGTTVAPHSVVMKHERLLPERVYDGVPTVPVPRGGGPADRPHLAG